MAKTSHFIYDTLKKDTMHVSFFANQKDKASCELALLLPIQIKPHIYIFLYFW